MKVTVQVKPQAAIELNEQRQDTRETRELIETAREMGVTLEPMHPGAEDASLSGYFTVPVEDAETAERIADRLRDLDAVEAAYLKPPDAMP